MYRYKYKLFKKLNTINAACDLTSKQIFKINFTICESYNWCIIIDIFGR